MNQTRRASTLGKAASSFPTTDAEEAFEMIAFTARGVAATELPHLNSRVVVLAEEPDGDGARLEISRSLTSSDQDRRLGQDTYCLSVQNGATVYGGIQSYAMEGSLLSLQLEPGAHEALGVPAEFSILLEADPTTIASVRGALASMMGRPESSCMSTTRVVLKPGRVQVGGLTMELPSGWLDVGDDLPAEGPPTVARGDGAGALQFSIARYKSGKKPGISDQDLRELLAEFGESRDLGAPSNLSTGRGRNAFAAGDFALPDEFVRVWYVSNGTDVVLVTYVTQEPDGASVPGELREASAIVESLDFA